MLNVVIPIVYGGKRYRKMLNSLSNSQNINVYVGVCSSQLKELGFIEGENIYIIEYQDGSNREEIINALQKYISEGSIIILRKPIKESEFNKFVNMDKDVVTCRKESAGVKAFFDNLWQKILKLCLGVRLYEGDTSVIYFAEDISSVILGSNNLSYNSRVDRWKGIEQGTVVVEGEKVKTDVDTKLNLRNIIISIVSIIIGVAVTTTVCLFANVNIVVGLLLFCLDVICVFVAGILMIMTAFNNTVGKKKFGFAAEVESPQEENYLEDGSIDENEEDEEITEEDLQTDDEELN